MNNTNILEHLRVIENLIRLDNLTAEINGYKYIIEHTSIYEVTVLKGDDLVFVLSFDNIASLEL